MYKKFTLDNGLRLVTNRMSGMRSIAIGIWIRAGGRYETPENKGISHFIEHLLFKGSKKYSCRRIKESIEGVGGSLNGFTSEELTCYFIKAPARYLNLSLDILSDMCLAPLFDPRDIQKERGVILEEIKMHKDLPQYHVYEFLDELLWPGQPLGLGIIGTPESVGAIDRGALINFKERHYTAPNMIISAAGLFDPDKLKARVAKNFSHLKPAAVNRFTAAESRADKPRLKILNKPTEQTHLAMGFYGVSRDHPRKYALSLLHIILGANMSSRLFDQVREKRGLAYEIGTQAQYYLDTGAFIVHAGIDNRKVESAIEVILKELSRIRHSLVAEAEFQRARDFFLGQLMLALEDTMDQMSWIGESTASLSRIYTLEEIIREIKKLTREDIRGIAQQVLRQDSLRLAMIGPLSKQEDAIYAKLQLK